MFSTLADFYIDTWGSVTHNLCHYAPASKPVLYLVFLLVGCTNQTEDTIRSGSAVPSGFTVTLDGDVVASDFATDSRITVNGTG